MPGRFTNGPEPQPDETTRIRNKLLNAEPSIQDFSINLLANGTIEIIVATTPDSEIITALSGTQFVKTA